MALNLHEMFAMSREGSDLVEMSAMIARDYLPGPWRHVNANNITVKKITGGLSNWLYQMSLPSTVPVKDIATPRTVLLRFHGQVNGESTFEHIVTESVVFTILSERKLGPKLYGIFPGGRVEEYINARPLTVCEMSESSVSLAIADKVAMVHQLVVPIGKRPNWLFDLSRKYIIQLTKAQQQCQPTDLRSRKIIDSLMNHNLHEELDWLREYIESLKSPVVFCHNDLNEGNILRPLDDSKDLNELVLIDYEYCAYNYRAYDIANHFLEHTLEYISEPPYFKYDPDAYPSRALQIQFARRYLKKYAAGSLHHDEAEEELKGVNEEAARLLDEVDSFRLAVHLFWALWSGANAMNKIPFGYWEFFATRFEQYLELKEEIVSFEVPGNKRKKT